MADEPIEGETKARSACMRSSRILVPAICGSEDIQSPDYYLLPIIESMARFADWPLMIAIRRALLLSLPLVLIGAFAHFVGTLASFPFAAALPNEWLEATRAVCSITIGGTFGLVALISVMGFSYSFAFETESLPSRHPVNPAGASIVALSCFFIAVAPDTLDRWREALSLSRGLPAALFVALSASCLFLFLARRSLFRLRLRGFGADPLVRDLLSVLPAAVATIVIFAILKHLQVLLGGLDLPTALSNTIAAPFKAVQPSAFSAAAYSLMSQVIWFFGGHGFNLLMPVLEQLVMPVRGAGSNASEISNIITWSFFPIYTGMGGSGSTLCLIIAILFADREPSARRLAWLSLLPALINVNEPLVFGLPLILNPIYAIPFVLTPVVLSFVGYYATTAGLVPLASHLVPWTVPPLISGYLATDSAAGILVQVAALTIGTFLYLPFVRVAGRLRFSTNAKAMQTLLATSEKGDAFYAHRLIDLPGTAGRFASVLASDLADAFAHEKLSLQYQPQVSIDEQRVFGVEALLRWEHEVYGRIPPPVTVALAEDMGLINKLGEHVLRLACRQRVAWSGLVPDDLIVSVNVAPRQLHEADFDLTILKILAEEGLSPTLLELEITESTSLVPAVQALDALLRLREAGVRIALDDFGMGHTSLHYLRELPLDTLKIDRSLTFTSQGDLNEHVIRSIVELSRTLGLRAVVEGIEQPEQLPRFIDLGCQRFQGYLFSQPLWGGDCLAYIRANGGVNAVS